MGRETSILERQEAGWPRARAEAKKGNPFATLCYHCFGRHAPPMDEICPHEAPSASSPSGSER